ncbi:MAG: hypothetical protein GY822_22820 [Deltaproteobacteria bacterium]|nr:hypothetical protein [Deltaproteobacteria bacterium]
MAHVDETQSQESEQKHELEADLRWGQSNAYQQSSQRWDKYSEEQKRQMDAEQKVIVDDMAKRLKEGESPTAANAMAIAEQHRHFICKWFYECDHWMHAQLAEMYTYDERFASFFNDAADILADYFAAAVEANTLVHAGEVSVGSALANAKKAAGLNASAEHSLLQIPQQVDSNDVKTAAVETTRSVKKISRQK